MGLRAKYTLFLSDLNKNDFSQQISKSTPNIKFHKNSFSGSRAVPRERKDGRKTRQTWRS